MNMGRAREGKKGWKGTYFQGDGRERGGRK